MRESSVPHPARRVIERSKSLKNSELLRSSAGLVDYAQDWGFVGCKI